MKNKNLIHTLDLQLFAEGGAGSGAAGAGAGPAGGDNGTNSVTSTVAGSKNNGVKESLSEIKYGTEDVQTADAQTNTPEIDRQAEFKKLIEGDYKDLFDARMQDAIQKRLKNSKEKTDKYDALVPTLETLAKKYGVDATDIEALNRAIEEDDSYYEDEALEKGITVQQLKDFKKMERENAALRQQMQQKQAEENGAKLYSKWMNEANATKSIYPGFDLRTEMQNQKFLDLLKNNIDVRTAFEVIHRDEIMPAAMQYTARAVEEKLTNSIVANGKRPSENGMRAQSATTRKSDVGQLTKDDIAEISRRVARGERIDFTKR